MRAVPGVISSLILLLAVAGSHGLRAQVLYARDARITIASNTTLSVRGDVENEGTIANNGHLKVSGPWVNSGLYEPANGEITFNSSSATIPQIIHHNGQTFNIITIAGGTKKVLLSDMVVNAEVHFQNGIVEAAGSAKLILTDEVAITGASDSSHVHGVVVHIGDGHKLFPVGTGLTYLPVELPDVRDPDAIIGVQALPFGNSGPSLPSTLGSIFRERYWHVDVQSGSLPASPIVLPLMDVSWADNPERLVVVQSESPTDHFTSIGRVEQQNSGRVRSEFNVSMPFIALATTAESREIVVYNAVSNNGDAQNAYLRIDNIEHYLPNKLSIFNRWGDKVFEIGNYDNAENAFRGQSNTNSDKDLVSGTYYYVLELPGRESMRGFISVRH